MDIKQFESNINQYAEQIFKSLEKSLQALLSPEKHSELIKEKSDEIINTIFNNIVEKIEKSEKDIDIKSILNKVYEDNYKELSKYITATNNKTVEQINENSKKISTKIIPSRFDVKNLNKLLVKNAASISVLTSAYQSSVSKIEALPIPDDERINYQETTISNNDLSQQPGKNIVLEVPPALNDESNMPFIPISIVETKKIDRSTIIKRFSTLNKLIESKINLLDLKTKGLRDKSKFFSEAFMNKARLASKWFDVAKKTWTKPSWISSMIEYKLKMKMASYVKNMISKTKIGSKIATRLAQFKIKLFRKLLKNPFTRSIISLRKRFKLFKKSLISKLSKLLSKFKPIKFALSKLAKLKSLPGKAAKMSTRMLSFMTSKLGAISKILPKLLTGKSFFKILAKPFAKIATLGGKALPGIGALFDAYFAYKSFRDGDPVKGAIYGINGLIKLAALFPLLTPFLMPISWAIDLGLLASDFTDVNFTKFWKQAGKPVIDAFKFIFDGRLWEATKRLLSTVKGHVSQSFKWMGQKITDLANYIWDGTKKLVNKGIELMEEGWKWWNNKVLAARDWAVEKANQGWDWMKEQGNRFSKFLSDAYDSAKSFVAENFEQLYSLLEKIPLLIKRVNDFKNDMRTQIEVYVSDKISALKNAYDISLATFKNLDRDIIFVVKNYSQNINQFDVQDAQAKALQSITNYNFIKTSSVNGEYTKEIINNNKTQQLNEFTELKKMYDIQLENPDGISTVDKNVTSQNLSVPESFKIELDRLRMQLLYLNKSLNT